MVYTLSQSGKSHLCTRRRFRANSPMMRSLLLVVLEVTTAISLDSTTGEGVAIVEVGSGPKRNGGGRAAPVLPEVNDVIKVLK